MSEKHHQRAEMAQWLVVELYILLVAARLAIAAALPSFWDISRNPFVAVLTAIFVVGLLFRRSWSWFALVVLNGIAVISYTWDSVGLTLALSVLTLLVLVSSPMRGYVRLGQTAPRSLDGSGRLDAP